MCFSLGIGYNGIKPVRTLAELLRVYAPKKAASAAVRHNVILNGFITMVFLLVLFLNNYILL